MRVNPWHVLLAVLSAAAVYLLSLTIERYEEPVEQGWSKAALRNPFLAAEQYLTGLSVPVESSDRLDVLAELTTDSTLVIGNANHVLTKQRAADLVAWMQNGGHVVVAAQYEDNQADVLLSHFEITKHKVNDGFVEENAGGENDNEKKELRELLEEASQQARDELEQNRVQNEAVKQAWAVAKTIREREVLSIEDNLVPLTFEGLDYVFQTDYSGSGSLSHPALSLSEGEEYQGRQPFYWAGNSKAVGFMQMGVGSGLLTVMADLNIWTSSQIGLFDHAFLLQLLTENSDAVVFLYGALVPSLLDLIWQHFYEVAIVLLILLAAWVTHRLRRFGPIASSSINERRSFKEHIQAVARFQWRQDMGDQLLTNVRREIWHRLRRAYPNSEGFREEQSLQKLAEASRINVETLRSLMFGAVPTDEIAFYKTVKSLQEIRKTL